MRQMLSSPEFAFIVSIIGHDGSEQRARADEMLNFVIAPAVRSSGLDVRRADLSPRPGPILDRIVTDLVGAKVIVADLTGANPNVYYEVGVAHALQKRVVLLIDQHANLPFDVSGSTVIAVGDAGRLGATQAETTKARLIEALQLVLADDYLPRSAITEHLGDGSHLPPEIVRAMRETQTDLYKRDQLYVFEVLTRDVDLLLVRLAVSYTLVNPTRRTQHYPISLTPVRPAKMVRGLVGGHAIDLRNADYYTARGVNVSLTWPPASETEVMLEAEVKYRCPDSDGLLTYVPATSYTARISCPFDDVSFVPHPLMERPPTRIDVAPGTFELRAPGAVLAYQGLKLDWMCA